MTTRARPLAFLIVAIVLAGCGLAADPMLSPSSGTGSGPLRILTPANGSTIEAGSVLVEGIAPPGMTVTQDLDVVVDPHTVADVAGRWSMTVGLVAGANKLTFRLGTDPATDVALFLTSGPTGGIASDPAVPASDEPSDVPMPDPGTTPEASPPPGGTRPAPFVDSGSGSRRSSAFTVWLPARVDYTFTTPGSGAFTASIAATDGSGSVGEIADLVGTARATTWVYGDGVRARVYLDVQASGSYTIRVTSDDAPAPKALPATFGGRWGVVTTPFRASGDVTVRYDHAGPGDFIVDVVDASTGEQGDNVIDTAGAAAGETTVAGLDGDYAFAVIAAGTWSLSVSSP